MNFTKYDESLQSKMTKVAKILHVFYKAKIKFSYFCRGFIRRK